MAELSGDAFVKALRSETVTLFVGPMAEPLTVSKALLCHKSDTFAKLLSKPGLTHLQLPGIGVPVGKIFVCWCYQERLQGIKAQPTLPERKEWKRLLIDLWLLGDVYDIPRLQNQVMKQLTGLFVTPSLMAKADIEYLWAREPTGEELKDLLVCTLVATLESANAVKTVADYEDLAVLPKFTAKLYTALKLWTEFAVPAKNKKNKWAALLQSEDLQKALRVTETKRKAPPQAAKALPKPFAPGEIIEID
ncbi:hypothetical protein LTR36_006001 [Oleoguttula mirabilis]|uniref:BTB domain-containing protein n=1 Tax=Oleoguttula mirabilis TaxID=1507867 RepID=A0AAV9JD10_9PEZI|nr:hypothetical protein LTR36_006001 [Oleoguttula mirabilis]